MTRLLLALILATCFASPAWADRWWVGGTGNWSDNTNHWAASSGGAPGATAPTSTDACNFDDNSTAATFTVTEDTTANCASFNVTIANTAHKMTLSTSTAQTMNVFGSWTNPGSTLYAGPSNLKIVFQGSGSNTITTNGVAITGQNTVSINAPGASYSLAGAISWTTASSSGAILDVTAGSFATNDNTITAGVIQSTGSATRSISLGASAINLNWGQVVFSGTGLSFNAGTSTITFQRAWNGAGNTFQGNGNAFNNFSHKGVSILDGGNSFNNFTATDPGATGEYPVTLGGNITVTGTLTGNPAGNPVRRYFWQSNAIGTSRTVTANGSLASIADLDFRDITAAGSAGTWSGTRLGDAGGNGNITTAAPKFVFWNLSGSQNWSATGWASSSGGTPAAANFPLPQDIIKFDNAGAAGTVTIDSGWNIGTVDMSGRSTAMTLASGTQTPAIYGSLTWFSSLTLTGTGAWTFAGRGTQLITSAGVASTQPPTVNSPGGTVKPVGAWSIGALKLTVTNGTFDDNGNSITLGSFGWGAGTGALTFNGGNWAISGSGAAWDANTNNANKSVARTVATGQLQMTSASAKTFAGGGFTYPTLVQAGAGALTIQQSNRFNDLAATALPSTVTVTNGTTQTFDNFTASGTSGNLLTINTPSAGNFATFSKPSGTVSVSNISLKDNHATGGAIWNAFTINGNVNVSGNQGWNFAPFNGGGNFFLFFGDLSPQIRTMIERAANDNLAGLDRAAA